MMNNMGFWNALKHVMGRHEIDPTAIQMLKDNPGKVVYTVCNNPDCHAKLKLYVDSGDKRHFYVEEIR